MTISRTCTLSMTRSSNTGCTSRSRWTSIESSPVRRIASSRLLSKIREVHVAALC
jgi:hypothetical protein